MSGYKLYNLAYEAMLFATDAHKDQVRKYSNDPYIGHLQEVAGIVATVAPNPVSIAIALLHDSMEDQDVKYETLAYNFGKEVADGVVWLTDVEEGNRKERKAAACQRLSEAPPQIQTIKYADLISNTRSIVKHDPKFAVTYLQEKRDLLRVMNKGDLRLYAAAAHLASQA